MSPTHRPARRPAAPAQGALFGKQVPIPAPRTPTVATQDPELVASVVRAATARGYVLIGPAQRVFLRQAGETRKGAPVDPVPAYEQDTVRQLLDAGLLTTGGTHIVRHGGKEGPATSVLVPKATRAMVTRWDSYRPLYGRGTGHRVMRRAEMARITHVDVVRPGRGLVTGRATEGQDDGFSGEIIRDGTDYLVEDAHGVGIGRARSYRAGAERLARHYDTDPGHVEITYERDRHGRWSGDADAARATAHANRALRRHT
ncbi:hypothetical protein [Pseudonocardia adelaidensis]